jgi:hypothetical protein
MIHDDALCPLFYAADITGWLYQRTISTISITLFNYHHLSCIMITGVCFQFRWDADQRLPKPLTLLLTDPAILKVGVDLNQDAAHLAGLPGLGKSSGSALHPINSVDLAAHRHLDAKQVHGTLFWTDTWSSLIDHHCG